MAVAVSVSPLVRRKTRPAVIIQNDIDNRYSPLPRSPWPSRNAWQKSESWPATKPASSAFLA